MGSPGVTVSATAGAAGAAGGVVAGPPGSGGGGGDPHAAATDAHTSAAARFERPAETEGLVVGMRALPARGVSPFEPTVAQTSRTSHSR
jgi:hypothetical protein